MYVSLCSRTMQTTEIKAGLIGHGIGLSRTPRMHMEEGKAHDLIYDYETIDTTHTNLSLHALLKRCETEGFAGVNITHPFKQLVLNEVDDVSYSVQKVGASNTVVFRDGKRFAHNTDYWGFATAFRQHYKHAPKRNVLLLGAGGAGSAIVHALLECGVGKVSILDASQDTACKLAERVDLSFAAERTSVSEIPIASVEKFDGIVNATPVGMDTHPGTPIPIEIVQADQWVADIIYFPIETQLLAQAKAKGCLTMNGSGMAIYQAARAFELFAGRKADVERMRSTFASFG